MAFPSPTKLQNIDVFNNVPTTLNLHPSDDLHDEVLEKYRDEIIYLTERLWDLEFLIKEYLEVYPDRDYMVELIRRSAIEHRFLADNDRSYQLYLLLMHLLPFNSIRYRLGKDWADLARQKLANEVSQYYDLLYRVERDYNQHGYSSLFSYTNIAPYQPLTFGSQMTEEQLKNPDNRDLITLVLEDHPVIRIRMEGKTPTPQLFEFGAMDTPATSARLLQNGLSRAGDLNVPSRLRNSYPESREKIGGWTPEHLAQQIETALIDAGLTTPVTARDPLDKAVNPRTHDRKVLWRSIGIDRNGTIPGLFYRRDGEINRPYNFPRAYYEELYRILFNTLARTSWLKGCQDNMASLNALQWLADTLGVMSVAPMTRDNICDLIAEMGEKKQQFTEELAERAPAIILQPGSVFVQPTMFQLKAPYVPSKNRMEQEVERLCATMDRMDMHDLIDLVEELGIRDLIKKRWSDITRQDLCNTLKRYARLTSETMRIV